MAAPALLHQGVANSASTASLGVTITAPANGSCLVAQIVLTLGVAVIGISGGGGTWALVKREAGTNSNSMEVWVCPNVQSGGTTVTVSVPAATNVTALVSEWSNMGKNPALDKNAVGTNASSTGASTGTTGATTAPVEVAFGMAANNIGRGTTAGPTGSFTEFTDGASANPVTRMAYRILSATGTQVAGWTWSLGCAWDAMVVTIKAFTAASGSTSGVGGGVAAPTVKHAGKVSQSGTGGGVASPTQGTARKVTQAGVGGGAAATMDAKGARASLSGTGGGAAADTAKHAASSSTAAAGGGAAAESASRQAAADETATGGGAASPFQATARQGADSATGGGELLAVEVRGASTSWAATGGGAAAQVGEKGGDLVDSATGGGVLGYLEVTLFGEEHYGSASATGGGTEASVRVKGALDQSACAGGGALASTRRKGARASQAGSGGGIAVGSERKGARASQAGTGGGDAAAGWLKDGRASAAAAGGGAALALQTTDRPTAFSAAGGGAASAIQTTGRSDSEALTGGGAAAAGGASGTLRFMSASLTGGGTAAAAEEKGAELTSGATGGGRLAWVDVRDITNAIDGKGRIRDDITVERSAAWFVTHGAAGNPLAEVFQAASDEMLLDHRTRAHFLASVVAQIAALQGRPPSAAVADLVARSARWHIRTQGLPGTE